MLHIKLRYDTPSESKSFFILSSSFQELDRIFSSSSKIFSASKSLRSTGGLLIFVPWCWTWLLLDSPISLGLYSLWAFFILWCLLHWCLLLYVVRFSNIYKLGRRPWVSRFMIK